MNGNNKKIELTQEGRQKYAFELDKLKNEDRIRVIEAIKDARSNGDLSENADYDAAREEQAQIENRIKELEEILKNATVIDVTENPYHSRNLGKIIELEFEDGEVETFELVGRLEANPLNNKVSYESPLGAAVLNAKAKDRVEVKTETGHEFWVTIRKITTK